MDRFDPFVKYADVYGDIINWEKDPMNKPQNQNKYFFSDGKTYYEQICKMLRLMSVFKEAFNQIYSNEDEISEAWENFVNNLSASVVEGSEPDVTLTWTDDSVNFEFTMVPGVPGEQGVGITSISFNSDYTMTITLSNGNTYTSMSLKGETGPQGPQGETGSGLQILDVYATLADLQSAHPTGQPGDAYQVGSGGNYILYIWSSSQSAWVQAGTLGTVSPYTSAPLMDGTASAGSQNLYARGDHVHPSDTSRASKEELDALIKTSQALIDQSFTYRESPAIQDGLARIDKIKGNTLVWNQLVENGNFADASIWQNYGSTFTVSGNTATVKATNASTQFGIYQPITFKANHKYLISFEVKKYGTITLKRNRLSSGQEQIQEGSYRTIETASADSTISSPIRILFGEPVSDIANDYFMVKNYMIIDLTQMGLDITGPSDFTSLFPLSYYAYNQGTLLSFNGSGIKTVGKNQFNSEHAISATNIVESNDNGTITIKDVSSLTWSNVYIGYSDVIAGKEYTFKASLKYGRIGGNLSGTSRPVSDNQPDTNIGDLIFAAVTSAIPSRTFIPNFTGRIYWWYCTDINNANHQQFTMQPMLSTTDADFEPYTSSTSSLPVSTYFPTGMKSAGTVYDELISSKAVTRIGAVDLGSLTWTKVGAVNMFYAPYNTDGIFHSGNELPNIKNTLYEVCSGTTMYTNRNGIVTDDVITINAPFLSSTEQRIIIADTSFTDANALKTALSGIYLYYEQETPVETSISPELDMDFRAYENGTEQLLPANGSVPSTSPIIADMTYLSIDDAMEYVLEKLANVPQNTQQILESLEDDVADLQTDVSTLQTNVSGLQTSVGNINTNIGQLSSTVAGHTASISDIQSDISDLNTGLSNLEDTVTDNTSRISTLETGLTTTNGNVQSLSSQVQSIDGRVTNLESDLFKVVVKEFDYDSVASESNFGTTTPIAQEEGYRVIGVVGTEAQAGEYTSPASNIAITQCHIYYTSLGALTITIFGRNTGLSARTNVRIYAYLLCIKDIQ